MLKKLLLFLLAAIPASGWCAVGDHFYSAAKYTDAQGAEKTVDIYFVVMKEDENGKEVYITAPSNDDPFKSNVNGDVLYIPSTAINTVGGVSTEYTVTGIKDPAGQEAGTFRYGSDCSFNKVVIPKTLIHFVGDNTLNVKTKAFELESGNPVLSVDGNGFLYNHDGTKLLRVPSNTDITTLSVNEPVTSIGDFACAGCKNLTTVNLNQQVNSIGKCAFGNCGSLTNLTLPEGLPSISEYAFYFCTSLKEVKLPSTVTVIGDEAFRNCSKLQSINFPEGLTSIGAEAFRSCAFSEIHFPKNLLYIGGFAFYGNEQLTHLDIPEGCTLGHYSFSYCTGLKTVILRHGVKFESRENNRSFSNCTNLSRVISLSTTAPAIVKDYTFEKCPADLQCFVPLGAELDYKDKSWPTDIRPMVNISKTTGKTFAYENNIDLNGTLVLDADFNDLTDNDLKAYEATLVTDPGSRKMKVEGKLVSGIVPAQTGLILYGSQNRLYVLKPTSSDATADVSANKLVGVLGDTDMSSKTGNRYFIYSGGMFYVSSGGYFSTTAGSSSVESFPGNYDYASKYAYKCYLDCGGPVDAKALTFTFDNTPTGITTLHSTKDESYYNLMGVKVEHPQKGVYIHEGKKIIVK